ncbi:hypothetical protein, partial [Phaeobacter sp. HF9A]|uniref:hypothetical protein n=1 Tax=Phaeobacter sp. HF9A TaxID=2721561 RepID=UPI00143104F8|nr:hypothetical protein [Phaeobacter sp. HF9A]
MTTPNSTSCITAFVKICFCLSVIAIFFLLGAPAAYAIPSPELVLGSVSSLSQILAVIVAALSAAGTVLATRLGMKPGQKSRRYPVKLIGALVCLVAALALANHWQWRSHKTEELQRLQATLIS